MRVLLAHKSFKLTGGADVFFFEVGRVLKENGHEVGYFSTIDEGNLESDFSKYFIRAPEFKSGSLLKKIDTFIKTPYNWEAKKKFRCLVDDFKPDIIHVFNIASHISPSIMDVARENNIPLVLSLNDYKHICPNYKLFHHGSICDACKGKKFYNAFLKKCCHDSYAFSLANTVESYVHHFLDIYHKNVDLFLFASDFMAEKTEELWHDKPFRWGKLLNPFKIPQGSANGHGHGTYGMFFGRIIEEKGVDMLIEALRRCPRIPFKIVGDGPDLAYHQDQVKKSGLNHIEFVGPAWGEKLDDILQQCRFVVVPSIWHENFPYVILQAFAASKPVIGARRGGIPEMVKDHITGLTYDADQPVALASAMEQLWADKETAMLYGKQGRKYLEDNFNDQVFYDQLIKNYKQVL